MSKRTASTAGAVAALAVLILLAFVVSITTEGAGGDEPPPNAECSTAQPYFYANDAPAGSHRFGPTLEDGSVEAGNARLDVKLDRDASFAAVIEDLVLFDLGKVAAHGDGWYTQRALQFLNNRELWCTQVQKIHDAIGSTSVADKTEKYHTFLMVPQGWAPPLVRRTERPVAMGHVLVLHLNDGRTENLRYVCDLQPARPEIPGLPPVSTPPGTPTVPPGGNTPVCPPDMPYGTWPLCKDSPSNDPAPSGNVPPQVQGQAPPVVGGPTPPAAGDPPPVYEPPPRPQPPTVPRPEPPPPNQGQDPDAPVPGDGDDGADCNPAVCSVA